MNTTHLIAVIAIAMALNTWVMIAGKKAFKRSWYMLWQIVTAPFRFTYNTVRSHWVAVTATLVMTAFAFVGYVAYDNAKRDEIIASYNHHYNKLSEAERDAIWAPLLEGQPHGDRTLEDE